MAEAEKPAFPLRMKLGLLAAVLATTPLPVVGFVLIGVAQGAIEHQSRELQLAVADDVAGAIAAQLDAAQDGLETVGRLLTSDDLPEAQAIAAALRTVEGEATLDHVAIYAADGALIDVVRERGAPQLETPARMDASLLDRATERGAALGEAMPGEVAPRVPVAVPLRPSPAAAPTGFAVSFVSLEGLQRRVERLAEHRFGQTERAVMVVDASAFVLAHADGPVAPRQRLEGHPLLTTLQGARFDSEFAHQRVYDADEERLGTLVSVPSRRWGVIVQVPTRVAFASIRKMRWVVGATAVAVVLLALLVGLWTARTLTAPIASLVELARKLGRRELGATVRIWTNDELRVLGDAMSQASTDLASSEARIRHEEAIRGDLGRYLPREIVERVVDREQDMALGGARREITVLFADVVSFTPLTESHKPEDVVTILNELFTILTEIVFRHGGTVDKFVGDAVMAIWNAPSDQSDHAERALAAAEDMMRWLETGNATWQERFGVKVQLAIGVHTGEAVVGNIGSETRMTYTAIGDVVNVAARLEAIARPQQILVSAATKAAAGEQFEYIDAGERELSGRRGTVHLYEVHA
ncbi:MAG: adenylate/guanylate cyclase domain-containing protein [Sandaracinaceae bacterium]